MSMNDIDLDFDEIDFGNTKPLPKLEPGNYACRITDWDISAPKSAESAAKGRNLKVKFQLADPASIDSEADFSNITFNDLIYFMPSNPFALLPLLAAIKGIPFADVEKDPSILGKIRVGDKSDWIGEEVGVRLVRAENRETGRKYLNPVSDAYYSLRQGF